MVQIFEEYGIMIAEAAGGALVLGVIGGFVRLLIEMVPSLIDLVC